VSAAHIVVIVAAVAVIALCTWAAPRRYHLQRSKSQHPTPRVLTIPEPITKAEYEAIKARWQALYGSSRNAHQVTPLCGGRDINEWACAHQAAPLCEEHDVIEWACVFNPGTARMEHYKRARPGARVDFAGSSCDGARDPLPHTTPEETT
jgi:hypothetical protein